MWINVYGAVDTMTLAEKHNWMWNVYTVKTRRPVGAVHHPKIKQLVSANTSTATNGARTWR